MMPPLYILFYENLKCTKNLGIWVYHIVSVTLYVCNCTPVRVYYEMCWHGDKFQPSTHVIILVKTSNIVPIAYNGNVILGIYFQQNYGYRLKSK